MPRDCIFTDLAAWRKLVTPPHTYAEGRVSMDGSPAVEDCGSESNFGSGSGSACGSGFTADSCCGVDVEVSLGCFVLCSACIPSVLPSFWSSTATGVSRSMRRVSSTSVLLRRSSARAARPRARACTRLIASSCWLEPSEVGSRPDRCCWGARRLRVARPRARACSFVIATSWRLSLWVFDSCRLACLCSE